MNITPPDHSRGIRFNQVSAGGEQPDVIGFSVGVASDGNAYAWGNNKYGQLGQDPAETTAQNTPTKVPLPDGVAAGFTYTQVAAGGAHTLAIGSNGILYSWGRNDHGQLGDGTTTDRYKPQPVSNPDTGQSFKVVHISAGAFDSAAIDNQGRVYTWGCENNNYNSTIFSTASKTPTAAKDPSHPSQTLRAVQVSVKWSFILALDEDGNVYAWGYNTNGQLGNGQHTGESSTTYASDPTLVKDPNDNSKSFKATQISAGTWHALAIGQDGSLYAWGKVNDTEYLTPSTAPIRDPNNSSKDFKATKISAGTWHSLAIDQDGNAWGWGWNHYGQTGSGSTSDQQATPIKVTGPNSASQGFKAVCISASHNHSLAIGQDGNTYAWGKNDYSQLGNTSIPTTGNSPKPIQTIFDPTPLNITSVQFGQTVGNRPTSKSDGTWTTTTPAHTAGTLYVIINWTLGGINQKPAQLNYTYIGPTHSVVFTDPQGGHPTFSQTVGDGSQASRPNPDPSRDGYRFDGWFVRDIKGDSNVAYDFSQPVTSGLTLVAHWSPIDTHWSINPSQGNTLGGQQATITPPGHTSGIRFNQVSAGGEQDSVIGFSVGVASDGNAYAWGNNQYGQLGQDPIKVSTQKTPTRVPLPDGVAADFTYTQVAAGGAHTLAIGSNGILYSWGRNDHGQLGDGTTTDRYKPQPVNVASNQPFKAVQVSAGAYDSAAIDDQGRVYTWGCEHNSYSTYGTAKLVPTLAKDPNGSSQGLHAVQVSAKWSFLLALDEDGSVYAWGYNTNGQLGNETATGDGNADYANDPKPVQDPKDANKTFKATQISAGTRHALAIGREDGSLYTWGKVNDTNYTRPTNDPTNTGKTIKATHISAGTWHSLAIDQDGNAWGWGWNQYGQTGNGNTNSQETPTKVTGPNNTGQGFKAVCVSAAHNHSLAIGQDGNAYAWGKNDYGQLGNTSIPATSNSPTPIQTMFDPTPLNITSVKFDKTAVDHLVQNSDGSVTLATPTHNPGLADVIVDWSLGGAGQTQAHLAYTYEGVLPLTGGNGSMILLLAAGLLAAAGAAAAGRHRRESHNLQA